MQTLIFSLRTQWRGSQQCAIQRGVVVHTSAPAFFPLGATPSAIYMRHQTPREERCTLGQVVLSVKGRSAKRFLDIGTLTLVFQDRGIEERYAVANVEICDLPSFLLDQDPHTGSTLMSSDSTLAPERVPSEPFQLVPSEPAPLPAGVDEDTVRPGPFSLLVDTGPRITDAVRQMTEEEYATEQALLQQRQALQSPPLPRSIPGTPSASRGRGAPAPAPDMAPAPETVPQVPSRLLQSGKVEKPVATPPSSGVPRPESWMLPSKEGNGS